jgi:hexosaminidase
MTPQVVPTLQTWTSGTGSWTLSSASRIVVDQQYAAQLMPFATTLVSDLTGITGLTLPVVATTMVLPSDIVLSMSQCNGTVTSQIGNEGNTLLVQNGVFLRAKTPEGVFHATRTLLQILTLDGQAAGAHKYVENGYSVDYPNFAFRSVMLDAGRLFLKKEFIEDYIHFVSYYKINTLHLHLSDEAVDANGVYHGYFRLISPNFPALFPPDGTGSFPANGIATETTGDTMHGYTSLDWKEMEAVAAAYGVEIEPEIDTPGHSTAFIAANPSLAVSGDPINLDTSNPATLSYIESVWAQFMPWFQSKDIMIGGDEAAPDATTQAVYMAKLANYITTTIPGSIPRTVAMWDDPLGSAERAYDAPLVALDKTLVIQDWNSTESFIENLGFPNVVNAAAIYLGLVPSSNTANSSAAATATYQPSGWTIASGDVGGQYPVWNDNAIIDALTDVGDNTNFKDMVPVIGQLTWTGRVNNSSGTLVSYATIGSALPVLGYGPGITELTGQLLVPPAP